MYQLAPNATDGLIIGRHAASLSHLTQTRRTSTRRPTLASGGLTHIMATRHTPRPLVATAKPKGGSPVRTNYERTQRTPSAEFNWGPSLYLQAVHARDLGYQLSREQQQRIKDGRP